VIVAAGLSKGAMARVLVLLVALVAGACGGGSSSGRADGEPTTIEPSTIESPSGQLVDIGGRALFVECRGSEGPTVVLEAGLTGEHRTWDQVLDDLDPETRVCAYDRANTGASDPAPTPRSALDVVEDLRALLGELDEGPPYLLGGFSFGGIFAQVYAAEHPEEIAGLVLIESNHPDEDRQFERHLTRAQIAADRKETQSNPEGIDVFLSFEQARAAGPLPPVPLIVVTATRSEGWPPGWDAEVFDTLRAEQQADLARRSPQGRQIFAKGSGHDVPNERPDVVSDAIQQVLELIASGT
jgi:pimeloyl-ACP methyl ester carboxylesterase